MNNTLVYRDVKWKEHQGALVPDVPPHITVNLTERDVRELLDMSGAYFLRWTSEFDHKKSSEFWYVVKDTPASLAGLSGNTRSKVRRGLKHCDVKLIDNDFLSQYGYAVYKDAFNRYNTPLSPISKDRFRELLLSKSSPEWEFWGAFDSANKLIAYSENKIEDSCCNYVTVKFDPKGLSLYSSYALFFEMNQYYLNENQVNYVCDGARSVYHETNIQSYLVEKFKFRKALCRLHVEYRKDVKMLVNILYPLRQHLSKYDNRYFAKISALLMQEEIRRQSDI